MKIIIQSTNVRLPKAPMVRPIIEISKFNVGQDFANLNTLSFCFLNFVKFDFLVLNSVGRAKHLELFEFLIKFENREKYINLLKKLINKLKSQAPICEYIKLNEFLDF